MEELGVTAFAERSPDKPALIDGERSVTFSALDRRINQLARALQRQGIGGGDVIACALANRIEWFEVSGAATRIGAMVVPVSWRNKRDEVAYLVGDSGSKVVFAEPEAAEVMAGFPAIFTGATYENMLGQEEEGPPPAPTESPVIGFRYYTSGTTGHPKAIEREWPTGEALVALRAMFSPPVPSAVRGPDGRRVLGRGQTEGLEGPEEVHLLVGPAYHTAPGTFANRALHYGQTVVLMRHFDVEECLRLIEEHAVTWSHMVPINFVRILKLPENVRARFDLTSVRRILHAAAPCPIDVKREIMEVFPAGAIYEYYGATEGLATVCPAEDWLAHPGTVGRAAPGIEVRVLDEDGAPVPPGEVGSVYFSTAMRFSYAGAPEKTEQAWRGDFFTAGDMGYLSEDGFLFLTDRKIDMIISGGANVYPAEVEGVLVMHPAVADVAVFGIPDPEWGERVHAVVELSSPLTADELMSYCRERLTHFKCPTSVEFTDSLPRDPNGKVRKRLLRDQHWTESDKSI